MFDPVRICEILNEERVRYVIVGGIATVMHGSSLTTRDLDVAFRPSGPLDGFDGWADGAVEMSMSDGLAVLVGSLDDIIESKRAAARPKDVAALPLLESLRDQLSE
jgi:hypothetical protein